MLRENESARHSVMVVGKTSEVVIKVRSVCRQVKVLIGHQWVIVGEAIDNVIKLRSFVSGVRLGYLLCVV